MTGLHRPLGLIENLFATLHDLGAMIVVNVAQVEGLLTPELLRPALDWLQRCHPMLQMHIVETETGRYLQSEGTPPIPVQVIEQHQDQQWRAIVEAELHQKFDSAIGPLCRVTLLPAANPEGIHTLVVTFHHAITDGLSCMHFIDELLECCRRVVRGEAIAEAKPQPLLPPLEKLVTLRSTDTPESQSSASVSQPPQPPQLLIEGEAELSDRRTVLLPRKLSSDLTYALKQRCQAEKTTVHGALCAAMLLSVSEHLREVTTSSVSCGSSVNLRPTCTPQLGRDIIGFFTANVDSHHILEAEQSLWNLARECKQQLRQEIDLQIPQAKISDTARLQQVNAQFLLQMSKHQQGRNSTVHISNLGLFELLADEELLRLKEFYFVPGLQLVGACWWLGAVTFHQQLFCTFAYVTPIISSTTAEALADAVIGRLQQAIN
jgi:NRPS condensation-like uncharacterized protein